MNSAPAAANHPTHGFTSWSGLAARWRNVASPLRPAAPDIAWAQQSLDEVQANVAEPRILLLGVTPELAHLNYSRDARLVAVDSSAEMIGALWSPPSAGASAAVLGRWQNLPLAEDSVDLVLADGSFCALPDGTQRREAFLSVVAALRRGGTLHMRTFVRPDVPETLERVIAELLAGRIGSVHAAKWRVAMALQGQGPGVALADVWSVFESLRPTLAGKISGPGWSAAALSTLEAYRDSSSHLSFPTLGETRSLFGLRFVERACRIPAYELGERCPTLTFRKV